MKKKIVKPTRRQREDAAAHRHLDALLQHGDSRGRVVILITLRAHHAFMKKRLSEDKGAA